VNSEPSLSWKWSDSRSYFGRNRSLLETIGRVARLRKRTAKQVPQVGFIEWLTFHAPFAAWSSRKSAPSLYPSHVLNGGPTGRMGH